MERAWRSYAPELGAVTTKINTIQDKAFVTSEVLLLSKLGTITALEVWTRGNSRWYSQGMLGDRSLSSGKIANTSSSHALSEGMQGNNIVLKELGHCRLTGRRVGATYAAIDSP
ncbi:hypothetical protein Acr_15g0017720 [Actinidia rufa]|uniref:Uncharacterized protein n=1 Tax=Actinidia rufa TaxID=165716 RepID=A0A7J0FX53_9ERIC|nr:hypothetical protein Acr_15g0017720 [Actinidia rufa]